MSNLLSLTTKQLRHAVTLKGQIEALTNKLASILGAPASVSAKRPKKRGMSAAGRAAVAAAQKARWAKIKTAKTAAKAPTKKRKMSAAGRAKIAATARARWAKIKAAAPAKTAPKPKRKISAAGRARLAALARARWKTARAQGKSTL